MTDFSSLQIKVNDLKAKVTQNSITPAYLGALLDDFIKQMQSIDMTDFSDDIRKAILNAASALEKAQTALSSSNSSVSTAESALAKATQAVDMAISAHDIASMALPRPINISELDTMGTDGSIGAMMALCRNSVHTRFAVVKSQGSTSLTVGFLDLISDNMLHLLTQVLTTHNVCVDGVLDPNSHTDGRFRQCYRSFGFAGGDGTVPQLKWTPWKEFVPESVGITTVPGNNNFNNF